MMKAYIDKRKCASDNRICKPLKECPAGASQWIEDEDEPLGSRTEIVHRVRNLRISLLWKLH